jgi:diguanylate cyclase (GGDEF)-like protein
MAAAYQHGWIRAAERLDAAERQVRRLVLGAQAGTALVFTIGGVAGLPSPTGWQLLLLAAALAWSVWVTDALARGRRPVEHCCMGQLPTALVALVAGVTGPRGSGAAAVAVLLLVVLGAAPYVERIHLAVLATAGGAAALGVLAAGDPGRFPWSWLAVLAVLGTGTGFARQSRANESMLRELVELEAVDAVTGLPNALYLRQAVQEAFSSAGAQRPLALVAVEIDRYVDFDSAHGFRVADEVLAGVAGRLHDTLPPGATFARGEGDVLVAVLPDADAGIGWDVAQALRHAAESRPPGPQGEPDNLPAVRIGVGIAVHPSPDVLEWPAASGSALLARAEEALREGMARGDGVRVARGSGDEEVARPAYV